MKRIVILTLVLLLTLSFAYSRSAGKWEVGFHYSYWSINIIAPLVEDFTPDLEYYDPEKGDFNFDSNGSNFGFELRFFPGGKNGAFSIGLSYERNNFKANVTGAYSETDPSGYRADYSAAGSLELLPHSFNLSLRWDLWPKARVHPYIGLGFGFGALSGNITALSQAKLYSPTGQLVDEEQAFEEWTLDEAIDEYEQEEGEEFPLGFFPIVHLQFGFRGEVVNNLYLLVEAAIYDGVILRGGIAYRF